MVSSVSSKYLNYNTGGGGLAKHIGDGVSTINGDSPHKIGNFNEY
jgi:hypothetical protein